MFLMLTKRRRKLGGAPFRVISSILLCIVALALLHACGGGDGGGGGGDDGGLSIQPTDNTDNDVYNAPPPKGKEVTLDPDGGGFARMEFDASGVPEFNTAEQQTPTDYSVRVVDTPQSTIASIFRAVGTARSRVVDAQVSDDGVVKITPKAKGRAQVTVVANMPDGTEPEYSFAVEVANRNPRTENRIEDLYATVGSPFEFTFDSNTFTDPDPEDQLTYEAIELPEAPWLKFSPASRTFSGTPTATPAGTILVTVTAGDGIGIATDTFTITINQPPTIVGTLANIETMVGARVVVEIASKFSDPDGDLRYTANSSAPEVATVAIEGDNLTVTAVAAGSSDITVTATETSGSELSVVQTFTVDVDAVNAPPTGIALTSTRIDENAAANSVVGTLSATDDGIGTLSYTLLAETDYLAFTITGNQLTINESPDYETKSRYSIRIRVSDGEFPYSEVFIITINDVIDTNTAPTDIVLSKTNIDENTAAYSVVGTLSATDDGRGTLTYALATGSGDTDNGVFSIRGNTTLIINASPDYETQSSYSIRIRVSDGEFTYSEVFIITINDVIDTNTAPTDIALSKTTIDENVEANTVVGTLSATDDGVGTPTYTLAAGSGATDNGDFTITGNTLSINASPDYETKSRYSIRIQVSDGELVYAEVFGIRVNDVNEAPTDIALSKTDIDENTAAYSVVGTLSATDDGHGTLTYALAAGIGDTDNGVFSIRGNTTLIINASPDYETQSRYSIRIQVSDGEFAYSEVFIITVNDVIDTNTAPTDIALSKTTIDENVEANTVVGTLSATDDGVGTPTYTLAAGSGATDNGDFTITGNTLSINASPDYETKSRYRIRIQVSDGELVYAEVFGIRVNDVNEAPTDIALSKTDIDENTAAYSVVGTLSATDDGHGTLTYALAAGNGDTDNGVFSVRGNTTLIINASPDYETQSRYSIRMQVSDGELVYAEVFGIRVNDVNEAPTDIALSKTDIDENVPPNSLVGMLSATDDGIGTLSYSFLSTGDHLAFTITGNELRINRLPNYETKSSYTVIIIVSDGEHTYSKSFTITVNDIEGVTNTGPSGIRLSKTTIDDNAPANSVVGTLSATDDGIGTLVYTLVASNAATDNGAFTITGTTLTINDSPDYATKSSYSIRIQVSDGQFSFSVPFTTRVNNTAPSDIALSKTDINEHVAPNSEVGTLSATAGSGTLVYTLVADSGATDNGDFTIAGNKLTINASPDYDTQSSYNIRIQVSDGDLNYSEAFTITVNANTAPTDIALSRTDIDENAPPGSAVGTLSATDDGIGVLSYNLTNPGVFSANTLFNINGNTLTINISPDYEYQSNYSIRIHVHDGEFGYAETVKITINDDGNIAPTDIALSGTDVDENAAAYSVVGTLSATDDGRGTLTYALAAGNGDTDNGAFTIAGNKLAINTPPDYGTQSSYDIRIQVSDGDRAYSEAFTISVNDNTAPSDIALSKTDIDEHVAPGTVVGTLSATDDGIGVLSYNLTDPRTFSANTLFNINGNTLTINISPDYETQSSYSIRIHVHDGEFGYAKTVKITINDDGNTAPTDIALSQTDIDENVAPGTVVGTLSATDDDISSLTYTLAAGIGDIDNGAFTITAGNTLTINASPDYETKTSYGIRIQVSDPEFAYSEAFTISVNDGNDAPTDIALSQTDIDENVAANTVVGTLSATDDDIGTLTYTLVAGNGAADNGAFTITGNTLTINDSPDYETKSTYRIRIQVSDEEYVHAKAFIISVIDDEANEAPTDIALSKTDIREGAAANSAVGTLSATDDSSVGTLTYTLAAGTGDTNNGAFTITGTTLTINDSPDYETKPSYAIRIQVSDGEFDYAEAFTITVNDVNDSADWIISDFSLPDTTTSQSSVAFPRESLRFSATAYNQGLGWASNTYIDIYRSTDSIISTSDYKNLEILLDARPPSGSQTRTHYVTTPAVTETRTYYYGACVRRPYNPNQNYDPPHNNCSEGVPVTIAQKNTGPTDIALSQTDVDENQPPNSVVGTLSATDDGLGTLRYVLLNRLGVFAITGNELKIRISRDYESEGYINSYPIRIRVVDEGYMYPERVHEAVIDYGNGNFGPGYRDKTFEYEEEFTITINNLNDNAVRLNGLNPFLYEHTAAGSLVQTLTSTDADDDQITYSLVAGDGNDDNGAFTITGDRLTIDEELDYETKTHYRFRIQASDGVHTHAVARILSVGDRDDELKGVALSSSSIEENVASGSLVATLTPVYGRRTIDFPPLTYSLVAGDGDTDNGTFTLSGDRLTINTPPNYEAKDSYNIRIRITNGLRTLTTAEIIRVLDVAEAANDVALSQTRVDENVPANTTIGMFTTIDEDTETTPPLYRLVAGTGSADNNDFTISGNELKIKAPPDYETKASYNIRIEVRDSASAPEYQKPFTVNINNIVLTESRVFGFVQDECGDGEDVSWRVSGYYNFSGGNTAAVRTKDHRSSYLETPTPDSYKGFNCIADNNFDEQPDPGQIDTLCFTARSPRDDGNIDCELWDTNCLSSRKWGGDPTPNPYFPNELPWHCAPCPSSGIVYNTFFVGCRL